jgi:hypothetical protein
MPAASAVADPSSALAPIVVDIVVPCPPVRAFDYFTRDIARWWPLATHSVGEADAVGVALEPRAEGRIVESLRDGSECVWGVVTCWEPGRRLGFTWHPGRNAADATWVDVTFAANPGGTRVTLTHGGWERRDDGAKARASYVGGWKFVLGERYRQYCQKA